MKISKIFRLLSVMTLFAALSGMPAAEAKSKAPYTAVTESITIQVTCNIPDAKVYADGNLVCQSTPGVITLSLPTMVTPSGKKYSNIAYARAKQSVKLTFVKDGYLQATKTLEPSVNNMNGKLYMVSWPGLVHADLTPAAGGAYDKDRSIVAGEATNRVSRDKAGQTALERTIIRWFFDSDPAGARIFWRVISSIPSEVKNTNETYLMTTPYEETRSFNILGLTYENSRDVQIEIKVSKKGYEDQIKRFNVRQAIDQQEISSFFVMVPKED